MTGQRITLCYILLRNFIFPVKMHTQYTCEATEKDRNTSTEIDMHREMMRKTANRRAIEKLKREIEWWQKMLLLLQANVVSFLKWQINKWHWNNNLKRNYIIPLLEFLYLVKLIYLIVVVYDSLENCHSLSLLLFIMSW